MAGLIEGGSRPDRVLVLLPQQSAGERFRAALSEIRGPTRGEPHIVTLYGLARQQVGLFFPTVAAQAGFARPDREPVFLNVEAAQYFLNAALEPEIHAFDELKLHRPRIVSQILDNLNKAATSGLPLGQLAQRLGAAWPGEPRRLAAYQAVQTVAERYRAYCLQHGLVDFSLSMTLLGQHLLYDPGYTGYIAARYRHVLADNIEEAPPLVHDFIGTLLRSCDSALLAEDDSGGYRLFLGADPASARALRAACDSVEAVAAPTRDAATSPAAFGVWLTQSLNRSTQLRSGAGFPVRALPGGKYWTGMVQSVAEQVVAEVRAGVAPRDIAVLAPFVEDVLRFELTERLGREGIALRTLRPSRPMADQPVVRALLVFARYAHPGWQMGVTSAELARALSLAIEGLDMVRSHVLAEAAAQLSQRELLPVEDIAMWTRVGLRFRERFMTLQRWVRDARARADAGAGDPLDLFFQRLFTDVLAQPGFGLNADYDGADVCAKLVRSARMFREVFAQAGLQPETVRWQTLLPFVPAAKVQDFQSNDIGLAYVSMLAEGMLAAQHVASEDATLGDGNAVLLAPLYAYLTNDMRSQVQFWLDVQSPAWHERLYQPLTHPYVLARSWPVEKRWSDQDEREAANTMFSRVLTGLSARCSGQIYLAGSQLSITGSEETGMLPRLAQGVGVAGGR
jgi:hypothetical protein